ncbi:MAG: hypothetical protein GY803_01835 [Chloroflexi bacterium]|nr:hypothetical protein [Chloroflexota bacterium]
MNKWDDPKPYFKWSIAVERLIAAPAEKVWETISMPGNLERCHPFCAQNPVSVWPGRGAIDEVHYLNGTIYERRFCRWIEGVGYDLEIGEKNRVSSFVSWRLATVGHGDCVLRIAVYPHILQSVSLWLRWLPYATYISPMLRRYLSSVVRGFEWFLIRGETVPRNQFGSHAWFSGRKPGIVLSTTEKENE